MFPLPRVMNGVAWKEQIMVEKDYKHLVGGIKRVSLTLSPSAANPLYGTKILNLKTQEIGLLICLWEDKYADKQ